MRTYFSKLGTKHLFKIVSGQPIGFFESLWMMIVARIIRYLNITLTNH